MTKEKLQEIKDRCEKATSGPWFVEGPLSPEEAGIPAGVSCSIIYEVAPATDIDPVDIGYIAENCEDPLTLYGTNNAEFIAHAREDIPLLIADNERLEALVKELQDYRQDVEVAIYGRRYWPSHEEFLEDIEKLKRGEFYKKSYVVELKLENKALEELKEIHKQKERRIEAELDEYGDYKG